MKTVSTTPRNIEKYGLISVFGIIRRTNITLFTNNYTKGFNKTGRYRLLKYEKNK